MGEPEGRLRVILEAEEALYVRLRDALQEEREVVARLDAPALEALARRKEELADEARLLEESRIEVAAELAASVGLPREGTRLAAICDRLPEGSAALREAHNRLVILVGVVRELVDANALLAGDSLAEVRSTLRLLGGLVFEHNLYRADGPGAPSLETGRLVRRSA